jgi:hypothetical protein
MGRIVHYKDKICAYCGASFSPDSGGQKFCCIECRISYNRDYSNEYKRNWRKDNPDKVKVYPESLKRSQQKYKESGRRRQLQNERKMRCYIAYSGDPPHCQCPGCDEYRFEFLSLDHINEDGSSQRDELGLNSSWDFYKWVEENNYPEGLQVLCYNCNLSKGFNGYCPHWYEDGGE